MSQIPTIALSSVAQSIIRTLLYFDIFKYPLTLEEIYQFSDLGEASKQKVEDELDVLKHKQLVFQFEDFYTLYDCKENIRRRRKGNEKAQRMMEKAKKNSALIAGFPFVRGVLLSGSISKNYMDEEADIDYFIITSPGRLWISRMLLILYKKIFLLNSYKHFCVNYFITTDRLEIEEKNVFTATELVTLIPTYGSNLYKDFIKANDWARSYYPNYEIRGDEYLSNANGRITKKVLEKSLNNRFGNWLNDAFMRLTLNVWKRKFKSFNTKDFEVAFKSKPYVSKHHPNYFQKKVLNALESKIQQFEEQKGVLINQS